MIATPNSRQVPSCAAGRAIGTAVQPRGRDGVRIGGGVGDPDRDGRASRLSGDASDVQNATFARQAATDRPARETEGAR